MAYSTEQMVEANGMAATLGYESFEAFIEQRLAVRVNMVMGRPGDLTGKQAGALAALQSAVESVLTGRSPKAPRATQPQVDYIMGLQDQVIAHGKPWERRDRASVERLYKDEASQLIETLKADLA